MRYSVDHHTLEYHPVGARVIGENTILVQRADDLTAQTHWHLLGYTIDSLFEEDLQREFQISTIQLLFELWRKAGLTIADSFNPESYHHLIPDFKTHRSTIEYTKLLPTELFPIPITLLEKRISAIIGCELEALNPFDRQRVFHFRIIRPNTGDYNPLHRDVWLEDYDDCINLYIPVAGSNNLSSLILAPGSHLWPESKIERTKPGARINDIQFNVPAVTHIDGDFQFVRPDPEQGKVLIFSPYLVHGGSVNLNADLTRISIEIRLWRKN